ncbi:hypothetical protein D3C77_786400 [compost metagenome]
MLPEVKNQHQGRLLVQSSDLLHAEVRCERAIALTRRYMSPSEMYHCLLPQNIRLCVVTGFPLLV